MSDVFYPAFTHQNLTVTDVRAHAGDSAFLIDDGTTSVLYDTGFAFTGFAVADNIKKTLGTRRLNYIFLTHSHYDHALGSAYIKEVYPDAVVVAGEYAVGIFAKPSAKRVMRELDRKFAAACGMGEYPDLIDNLHVDMPVKDGDTVCAGDMHFTVVGLPGHTRCSIGFYLPSHRLLLASETLGVYDGYKTVMPSYLVGYELTLESIRKANRLEIDRVLLPHRGLLDKEKSAFYLQNAEKSAVETYEAIVSVFKNGGTKADAFELFRKMFYTENIRDIYPIDAFTLNTGIMVELIAKG